MRPRSSSVFDQLLKDHGKAVLALVWTLGVSEAEREDVAQEVWWTVARNLDSYEPRSPRGWLGTITRNAVKTWRRTRRRRPEFSADVDEGAEPVDLATPEKAATDQQRRQAVRAFLFAAIPDEGRREAFLLHTLFGQTMAEVAESMGVSLETARGRLKMARRDLERAKQAMSGDDRAKLRAFVVPFASVDAMIDDLRSSVSDEEATRVRDRVCERIALEGNGDRVADGAPTEGPSVDAPTSSLLPGVVGAFLVGVMVGAGSLYAFLSREKGPPASIVAVEAPGPVATAAPEPLPKPGPTARVSSSATISLDTGAPWEADSLLARARRLLTTTPRDALALVQEHGARFPKRDAVKREEIAIRALLQLGQRAAAEARAARLIAWAPSMRAPMADLLGHEFP